ncbi:MAG: hypothetical protein ACRC5C_01120 [Bacilli bacterium]
MTTYNKCTLCEEYFIANQQGIDLGFVQLCLACEDIITAELEPIHYDCVISKFTREWTIEQNVIQPIEIHVK